MAREKYCPQCSKGLIVFDEGGAERLGCPDKECGYVFWGNPTPVVGAIVELNGEIILARNANWPEGQFGLITGFLEHGEVPENAVLREVEEELGLYGEIENYIGHYMFKQMNQLIMVWHIQAQGEVKLDAELAEVKYVLPEELRPWRYGTGPAVRDWLDGRYWVQIEDR
ncbi:MAG: NUDIX domain-containing protein [Pseudomonadota bacterium]